MATKSAIAGSGRVTTRTLTEKALEGGSPKGFFF